MIDKMGYYTIKDYDKMPPFSSFLAGVAGVTGKPLWTFFINRGQGISAFGIRDKNGCMMEFYPANEAYKLIYTNGFRTFVKLGEGEVYEPFAVSSNKAIFRTMKIKNNELQLEEVNNTLNLKIIITYYIVPNESFGALARRVEIENLGDQAIEAEVLDGMPALLPYGTNLKDYKEIGNTLRSWMQAEITSGDVATYKLRASSEDTTEIKVIDSMYYYKALDDEGKSLTPIIDPQSIFGYDTSYSMPIGFFNSNSSEIMQPVKVCCNKVPSAFCHIKRSLVAHQKITIYSYMGYANKPEDIEEVNEKVAIKDYFESQMNVSNALIDQITSHVETQTAYPLWDAYVKQSYLDNVLRGGYPVQLGKKTKHTYYIYSRKHGDLERDYNFFAIEPNYYSQGNANYRDVCQNRRMDTYLHSDIKDENIKLFYDLIQIDGYNPLVISGKKFIVTDEVGLGEIKGRICSKESEKLENLLTQEFTVGDLYGYLKEAYCEKPDQIDDSMNYIIDRCETRIKAEFGEGFWIDHWTYTLDLVEQFLDIYPDERKSFLVDEKKYRYFNSSKYVLPRSEKYVLEAEGVRQYQGVKTKEEKLTSNWLNTSSGEVYTTHLMSKLLTLALIKFSTLDPYGLGIEMEAGKPGWNDAMNGMPGILGSSTAEMFELKRLLHFIEQNLDVVVRHVEMPIEFRELVLGMEIALKRVSQQEISQIDYWDTVTVLREEFRVRTKYTVIGDEYKLETSHIQQLVVFMLQKIEKGIDKLKTLNGDIIPTFLYYEVDKFEIEEGSTHKKVIKPTGFKLHVLPEFLEGPVKYLKTQMPPEEKATRYEHIKASGIYDKKLKMYKVSESLEEISHEIGRSRVFTPGWLERESIFMHMAFKYILELIKNNLYEEFFEDMKYAVPAFMNPETYGRSLLENSSFIASSANPDSLLHGRGFIARLSGTTVEFLNIWKIMMTGHTLFSYENELLSFKLEPILTKDFFDKDNQVKTTILGNIQVVYSNKNRVDTFGKEGKSIKEMILDYADGKQVKVEGNAVSGQYAQDIRNKKVTQIRADIY